MLCPVCGSNNLDNARFCDTCGNGLQAAVVPVPPQPVASRQYPQQPYPQQAQYPPQGQYPSQGYPQQAQYPPQFPGATPGTMRGMAPNVDPSGKTYAYGKSPGVAVLLSFLIVGIGQAYNGDIKKWLAIWGIMIVGSVLTLFSGGILGVVPFGVWIWSMIDAYNVASRKSPIW